MLYKVSTVQERRSRRKTLAHDTKESCWQLLNELWILIVHGRQIVAWRKHVARIVQRTQL